MDEAAVERAAERYRFLLPRAASAGRVGLIASSLAGSSLELHDFRDYQPGDDPRHIDWNAAARTGKLVLRLRREEVAPRTEVLVDASRSMAVSPAKAERTRELAALFAGVARAQGLSSTVHWLGAKPGTRTDFAAPPGGSERNRYMSPAFDATAALPDLVARAPLRPCGVRLLVSDFLVDAPLRPMLRRLAEGAGILGLVVVLDEADEEPSGGIAARLLDAVSDDALDRVLGEDVLSRYRARMKAHLDALLAEARRVRATVARVRAEPPLETQIRERLSGRVLEPRARA
jgi:uncharacterized protein (DUF58 family)